MLLLLCLCKLSFVWLVMLVFADCPDFSRAAVFPERERGICVRGHRGPETVLCVFLCVHMLSCLVFLFLSLRLCSARSLMSRYRVLVACALPGPARVWLISSSMTSGWPCGTKPRWCPCRRIWQSGWAACWVNLLTQNKLSMTHSQCMKAKNYCYY